LWFIKSLNDQDLGAGFGLKILQRNLLSHGGQTPYPKAISAVEAELHRVALLEVDLTARKIENSTQRNFVWPAKAPIIRV
jgi:hypothetical protein